MQGPPAGVISTVPEIGPLPYSTILLVESAEPQRRWVG